MGQYWKPVNLTKREFIDPHKLGAGLKLREQLVNSGVGQALVILTAAMPVQRGGGDFEPSPIIGNWSGDRIAIVGDYAKRDDLPEEDNADEIFSLCCSAGDWDEYLAHVKKHDPDQYELDKDKRPFTDVTDDVCAVIERELNGKFVGSGWRHFEPKEPF
jgi:hypothetical protein